MIYEDELRQGLEAARAAGATQDIKVLERELHRVSLKQARQADTSSPVMQGVKNWGAGLTEGALALPDLVQMGTELMVPDKLKIGPKDLHSKGMGRYLTENVMGMAPDRSSTAFEAGNITGGSVLGLPGSGVRGPISAAWKAAKDIGAGFTGAKAGDIGQYIGDKFGYGTTGETAGEFVGSMAPGVMGGGIKNQINKFGQSYLSDPASKAKLNAIDLMNSTLPEGSQIPVTAGLIGNQDASYFENFTGILPFVGGKTHRIQEDQLRGWSDGLDQLRNFVQTSTPVKTPLPRTWAADIQSSNPDFPTTRQYFRNQVWTPESTLADPALSGGNPDDLGRQMGDIASYAYNTHMGDIDAGESMMTRAIGSDTEIPTNNVDPVIARLQRDTAPDKQTALAGEQGQLDIMRRQTNEYERLSRELQQAIDSGNKPLAAKLQDDLDTYMQQGMVRYPQLRDFRTGVGRRSNMPSLEGAQRKPVYEAITNSLRDTAEARGVLPQLDELQNLEAKWYQQHGNLLSGSQNLVSNPHLAVPFDPTDPVSIPRKKELKVMLHAPTSTDRYNWLQKSQGPIAPEKFDYLARAAGGGDTPKFRQFAGDYVAHMGVPRPGSGKFGPRDITDPYFNGEASVVPDGMYDPVKYSSESRRLQPMSKQVLANNVEAPPNTVDAGGPWQVSHMNDALFNRLNAQETVATAMKQRGKAGNPSGSTIMAIPAHTMKTLTTNPGGLHTGLLDVAKPTLAGMAFRDMLLNEDFARSLGGDPLPSALTLSDWLSFGGRGLATTDNALRGDY